MNYEQRLAEMEKQTADLHLKYTDLKEQIAENTQETKASRENTEKIVKLMESWEGAIRVLEAIGRFFRPVGYIAAGAAALVAFVGSIKGGVWPK